LISIFFQFAEYSVFCKLKTIEIKQPGISPKMRVTIQWSRMVEAFERSTEIVAVSFNPVSQI
jgi:hypothetical protein